MSSKNIALIGFMGTGKTRIGKMLAKRLNRPMVDVDRYIEVSAKKKISEIFRKDGEAFFRNLEKEAIHEICERQAIVITTGGGAALNPENLTTLKSSGWVVGLSASPETIYCRVKDSNHRPLLDGKDKLKEIERLLEIRKPYYEKADFYFETDGKSPAQMADIILKTLAGKI